MAESPYCPSSTSQTSKRRNTRKRKSEDTPPDASSVSCCPLCGQHVEDFETHYQQELHKLEQPFSASLPTFFLADNASPAAGMRRRRRRKNAAQAAQATGGSGSFTHLDRSSAVETLQALRRGRKARNEARSGRVPPRSLATLAAGEGEEEHEVTCFICGEKVVGDLNVFNLHIDACLCISPSASTAVPAPPRGPSSTSHPTDEEEQAESKEGEEYEWNGQTRIRATSLMDRSPPILRQKRENEDLEIEIEDDGQQKPARYDPRASDSVGYGMEDLIMLRASDDDETPAKSAASSSPVCTSAAATGDVNQKLLLDALKDRIKELERQVQSTPTCLICLEPYVVPVVSVNCWHVHCEKCWLRTLGAKKLCPRCQTITSPLDLRKIYM